MGVISIVVGIINQLITGGAPPCSEDMSDAEETDEFWPFVVIYSSGQLYSSYKYVK